MVSVGLYNATLLLSGTVQAGLLFHDSMLGYVGNVCKQ
jgi:uncharacterized membrane protein YiaA